MPRPQVLLCYHKVGSAATEGRWLNVEPARLRAHVRHFHRRGWRIQTARDAVRREKGTVGFQFDDAYASALRHATPIFAEFGARATFWAVPSQVGGVSAWDGDRAGPLADWDALIGARGAGHEIGNHTWSHRRLDGLDLAEQTEQIGAARVALADRGFATDSICFPYGAFNAFTLAIVARLDLEAGFSLGKRPVRATDPSSCFPRIVVGYSDSVAGLLYKIYVRPRLP